MNCNDVRLELPAFLDGETTASGAEAVGSHLRSCSECAAIAAQHRAADELLSGYRGIATSEAIERAILAEVERSRSDESKRRWLAKPRGLAMAASLAATLVVGFVLWNSRGGGAAGEKWLAESDEQEIASNLDLYENLDELLSPDSATYFDLLAAEPEDDEDDDRGN